MSCNGPLQDRPLSLVEVSIPIGFSNELQRRRRRMTHQTDEIGFNPYRVFQ